ncbi:24-sterol C-methyltransferase protein [Halorhabdus tiamatea SARL4B]|uniref:24-sterol C-methyltransferase protein n=1 Tax=Halorhabdus tiamatea SARL4B TaxID=1033806 RepID=F7PPY2_9EURY|nr:class I SAM-dependent methyltransferase [Halorhabdus tiamatea]ERJ07327.1 24-sterol C-methyltransferase protein [Halorhabdus tiamatea SARL4B]CCQ34104.1 methyltransferase type 11 [Halorhabdus tiamatea SARL4B]
MSVGDAFDEWAEAGKDRGMEQRHWHTAKHALGRMPVEDGDVVLDLGCGSGYAARALRAAGGAGRAYGLDRSPQMAANAREYTDDAAVGFLVGDFQHLPFETDSVDHAFSMEAIYYAPDPVEALRELCRVLRSGGTFYCAVDYVADNPHTAEWDDYVDVEMTRWSRAAYREAFREAGFHVAEQEAIPDEEVEIPPAEAFPTEDFETREAMVEHYREHGTLLTVGVVP